MKKIYLANPYGFSELQRELLLPELIEAIQGIDPKNVSIFEPFNEVSKQVQKLSRKLSVYEIGQLCLKGVSDCDAIFAVLNGNPPDEGVMVELGYAMALNKKIFLFRDDFRNCSDSISYPLNLMVFSGLDRDEWDRNYYRSIKEIEESYKNLYRWIKSNE